MAEISQIERVAIEKLIPYVNNAKEHSEEQIIKIASSIREFGFVNPVLIDKELNIIAGHGRVMAAKKLKMSEVPCVFVEGLSDAQRKAYILADNRLGELADWNMELVTSELEILKDINFDIDLTGFELNIEDVYRDYEKGSLKKDFLIPPFSVFDTRKADWRDRKKVWIDKGLKSGAGRDKKLISEEFGTSIFDPVLTEICYKWFNVQNGSILDPFAGGAVRGIVAAELGYSYFGNDLRKEQINANYEIANKKKIQNLPIWTCGDSIEIKQLVPENSYDMIFSCPPYADLEKYSDDPKDISNMAYQDFLIAYKKIIKESTDLLRDDRFAIFVVGDVRDKNGNFYDFISDTKKAFIECGLKLYNEIILIDPVGTGALRARNSFKNRKLVKVHQNVLVFYKGDNKNIQNNYNDVEVGEIVLDNEV